MSGVLRTKMDNVASILLLSGKVVIPHENQTFYETNNRIELWDETPLLRRVHYWNKTSVPWITEKENPQKFVDRVSPWNGAKGE